MEMRNTTKPADYKNWFQKEKNEEEERKNN
jgi:hypothetical protein